MVGGKGRDVLGCALMRALAGAANLSLTWLHPKAIPILWLHSFVLAQRLHNCLSTPPPPIASAAIAHKHQWGFSELWRAHTRRQCL